MSVYVDDAFIPHRFVKMCHMMADSVAELHSMADRIGFERRHFHLEGIDSEVVGAYQDNPSEEKVKKIVLVGFLLVLGSCGQIDRSLAHIKGAQEICFKGVEYVQFASGASVEYGPDGQIVSCK